MDSKTYYLKYRPQKISELDLVEIREGLTRVLSSGHIPHAFLFAGPKGTGKTSAARIIAKAVNCLSFSKKEYEPCNQCENCRAIVQGRAVDLIEIDAASNRGIDDIRRLKEGIKLAPAKCRYKVYIIDEVHMLTMEAFNALLKTLEEPPSHAIFILCTTTPQKLPPTIVSRCLRFQFRKAQKKEVIAALKRVVRGEGLRVEKGVLSTIASAVDGSFRDAHKILEQLSFGTKQIRLKKVEELLGKTEMKPRRLLSFLGVKDAKASLLEIRRVAEAGVDLVFYLQELLERLRCLLLEKLGLKGELVFSSQEKRFSLEEIKRLIELFSQAVKEVKVCPLPQLPLELVVVEYCLNEKKRKKPRKENNNAVELREIEKKWTEVLAKVKPLNHSVEALLRAARPVKLEGEFLTLEVFYKFHKERLETEKCRRLVEETATQVLGEPIKVRCVLREKKDNSNNNSNNHSPHLLKPEEKIDVKEIIAAAEEIFGVQAN